MTASLRQAASNVSFRFIGNAPVQTPALDRDAQTVRFAEPVTCLLEVKYEVRYLAYQLALPTAVDNADIFEVLLAVSHANTNSTLLKAQRGIGDKPLADYSDALMTTAIAESKAQALLDASEKLMKLRVITTYKTGMDVGNTIGFFQHNGERGLWVIDAVELRYETGGKLTVTLDVFEIL